MRYSIDLRKRVLDFLKDAGNIAEAARRFGVSRQCIYKWLNAEDPFASKKPGPQGPRCLDYDDLKQHVSDFPDATQLERATHFGVSRHCIWYALKKLNITRKKTADVQRTMPTETRSLSLLASDRNRCAWQNTRLY